ncbi:MAG: hypothetical protein V1792_07420 [Pseudomonadota bacterium]
MNTTQNSQLKRSIRVRDFLDDFHAGMTDEHLLEKYHLTSTGLERFYDMLQDRGIIDAEELLSRYSESCLPDEEPMPERDTTSFICPSCLASHQTMFDICPDCGVSFQDMISREGSHAAVGVSAAPASSDAVNRPGSLGPDRSGTFGTAGSARRIEAAQDPGSSGDFFVDPSRVRKHDRFSWPGEKELDRAENDEFGPADNYEFGNPGSEEFATHGAYGYEDPVRDRPAGSPDGTEAAPRFESFVEEPDHEHEARPETLCESCDEVLEPALRDVYDRKRSHTALILSAAFMVLGLMGSAAVTLFDGYSLGRLFAVYGTGMCLLGGAILSSVGAFMYLARERVYFCSSCRRVYPRA